jgi:hypothetical protein
MALYSSSVARSACVGVRGSVCVGGGEGGGVYASVSVQVLWGERGEGGGGSQKI